MAGDDRGVLHVCNFEGVEKEPGKFKEPGKVRTIMATRGNAITSLAIRPSKSYVLLSTASSIMIWDTEDWTCIRMYHGPSYFRTVTHASFNTNEHRAFGIGCCDGKVKVCVKAFRVVNVYVFIFLSLLVLFVFNYSSNKEQVLCMYIHSCGAILLRQLP